MQGEEKAAAGIFLGAGAGRLPGGARRRGVVDSLWEENASKIPIDERARFFSSALRFVSPLHRNLAQMVLLPPQKLSSENRNGMADR
jgi:hypothetical protein